MRSSVADEDDRTRLRMAETVNTRPRQKLTLSSVAPPAKVSSQQPKGNPYISHKRVLVTGSNMELQVALQGGLSHLGLGLEEKRASSSIKAASSRAVGAS